MCSTPICRITWRCAADMVDSSTSHGATVVGMRMGIAAAGPTEEEEDVA